MKEIKFPYSGDTVQVKSSTRKFLQTEELTENGVAVHPYGAIINPNEHPLGTGSIMVEADGETYEMDLSDIVNGNVGATVSGVKVLPVAVVGSAVVGTSVVGVDPVQ